MHSRFKVVPFFACAVVSSAACAGHPLVSETAAALARGTCHVEFNRANEKAEGAATEGLTDVQFTCGAGARSQYAIGLTSTRINNLRVENYRAAGKTTLVAADDGIIGWGLHYRLGWATTQGQKSTELDSAAVLAVATREIRNGVLLHANLGFKRNRPQAKTTGLWSLGVETTDALSWAADVYGEEGGKPAVSVGAGWRAGKDVTVSVAYAAQTGDEKAKKLSLGLRLVF